MGMASLCIEASNYQPALNSPLAWSNITVGRKKECKKVSLSSIVVPTPFFPSHIAHSFSLHSISTPIIRPFFSPRQSVKKEASSIRRIPFMPVVAVAGLLRLMCNVSSAASGTRLSRERLIEVSMAVEWHLRPFLTLPWKSCTRMISLWQWCCHTPVLGIVASPGLNHSKYNCLTQTFYVGHFLSTVFS